MPIAGDQKISINRRGGEPLPLGRPGRGDLYDYADNEVADSFATVRGVARVDVVGGNEREVWSAARRLVAAG